jgi:hypothetical protein
MATNYPISIDTGTSLPYPTATDNTNSPSLSGGQDNQNDAIIALESLVGTNSTQTTPSAQYNVLQATSGTASEWGFLTVNNVSSSTGTGDFVFATSPTISSPTISSPTISSPTITGSLGNVSTGTITANGLITGSNGLDISGGTITLPSGSITFADLLSTIFSGQVTTYTNGGTAGGTGYYVNIGGIKLCWGQTIFQNSAANFGTGSYYSIDFPSGFFNSITGAVSSVINTYAVGNQSVAAVGLPSTASWSLYFMQAGSVSGAQLEASWIVIGS